MNTGPGLLVADANLQILSANRDFCNMFCISSDILIGRPLSAVLQQLDLSGEIISSLLLQKEAECTLPGQRKRLLRIRMAEAQISGQDSILILFEDVTAGKKDEASFGEKEELYRDLVEHTHAMICIHDLEGKILSVNQWPANVLGYEPGYFLGKNIRDILAPEVQKLFPQYMEQITTNGFAAGNMLVITASGERRIWEYHNTLRAGGMHAPIVRGLAYDITEKKKTEQSLRESQERYKESEERFRLIAENAHDLICILNEEGKFVYVSPSYERVLGYKRQALLGTFAPDIVHPEDLGRITDWRNCSSTEFRIRKADGTHLWVEALSYSVNLKERFFVVGIARDISERKEAEQTLRRQNEYLAALHETTLGLINRFDVKDLLQAIISRATALVGISSGFIYLVEPDESEMRVQAEFGELGDLVRRRIRRGQGLSGRIWETGEPMVVDDYSVWPGRLLDQRYSRLKAVAGVPLKSGSRVMGVIGVDSDDPGRKFGEPEIEVLNRFAQLASLAIENARLYTAAQLELGERKQIERALRESELKYRNLFEYANDAILIFDPDTEIILEVNLRACRLYGYDRNQLLGMNLKQLSRDVPRGELQISQGIREGANSNFETVHVNREGLLIHLLVSSSVIEYGGKKAILSVNRDITELKLAERQRQELEQQLIHAQKLEAIGRLAGGVAHDFNNLLMAITGYCELLLLKTKSEDSIRHDLEEILASAERGASLTKQLLAFGRRQMLQPKVLDLNQVVLQMNDMLRRLIGEDVELVIVLDDRLGRVKADPGQMEQVIVNLAVNARDAMPHGGQLLIQTANVEFPLRQETYRTGIMPGSYVQLIVKDTGLGMDEGTISRIFEPFFSRKQSGKGTGLGLATVYGIVKQSEGYITVDSKPGEGSKFEIHLPRVGPAETVDQVRHAEPTPPSPAGSESILLVDDDHSVRSALASYLEMRGFHVLQASHGEEALEISRDQRVDVLVTDVVMPRMGGHELAQRLISLRPDVKVLFMSGYMEEVVFQKGFSGLRRSFLQKPVPVDVIVGKIRELLDTSPASENTPSAEK